MNLKIEAKRDQILSEFINVRKGILETVCEYPATIHEQVFLGYWSIKDLLAHLIGWDFTNLDAARDVQCGRLPNFYTYIDKDWRSYNALLVIQYKRDDYNALLACTKDSQKQLTAYLETLPVENFFKDWGVRYKGIKVTISRLLVAETKDEKVHLAQVKAFVK